MAPSSSATRLSRIVVRLTRGFASHPHGWFAFIGRSRLAASATDVPRLRKAMASTSCDKESHGVLESGRMSSTVEEENLRRTADDTQNCCAETKTNRQTTTDYPAN
jgi:hypothetical protein